MKTTNNTKPTFNVTLKNFTNCELESDKKYIFVTESSLDSSKEDIILATFCMLIPKENVFQHDKHLMVTRLEVPCDKQTSAISSGDLVVKHKDSYMLLDIKNIKSIQTVDKSYCANSHSADIDTLHIQKSIKLSSRKIFANDDNVKITNTEFTIKTGLLYDVCYNGNTENLTAYLIDITMDRISKNCVLSFCKDYYKCVQFDKTDIINIPVAFINRIRVPNSVKNAKKNNKPVSNIMAILNNILSIIFPS